MLRIIGRTLVLLAFISPLGGCAAGSNHQGIYTRLNECGLGTAKYPAFQTCAHEKVKIYSSGAEEDYYSKTRRVVLEEVDALGAQVSEKKLTTKQAYQKVNTSLQQKIAEEEKQAQEASTIIAVGLVGVAAVSCANNGGCGLGGGSSYQGNCECPKDIAADGTVCGGRSAWSRSGGATPFCPAWRI